MAEITLNRPNWLGSEVGMVLKTTTIKKADHSSDTLVKSGTLITDTNLGKGLLFNDVDVSDGDRVASIMIRGSYINEKLPTDISSSAEDLIKQGLYAIKYADTTIAYGEVTE